MKLNKKQRSVLIAAVVVVLVAIIAAKVLWKEKKAVSIE